MVKCCVLGAILCDYGDLEGLAYLEKAVHGEGSLRVYCSCPFPVNLFTL